MNNHDMSNTGENIEFNVFYDTDLSQIYFDEWLNGADGNKVEQIDLGGRDNYLYLIGDSDAPYYKKSQFSTMRKADIFELWLNYEFGYNVEINDYPTHEYISDLLTVSIKRHYEWIASQYSWHELSDKIPHDSFISRGYSQGDAVYIVSIDQAIDKPMRESIDHILWDCPVYIRAEINGHEFYEDSFLTDIYNYDTDEIKANIKKLDISDYAKQWLCDKLPSDPDYLL